VYRAIASAYAQVPRPTQAAVAASCKVSVKTVAKTFERISEGGDAQPPTNKGSLHKDRPLEVTCSVRPFIFPFQMQTL
jgi:hypothetical protein